VRIVAAAIVLVLAACSGTTAGTARDDAGSALDATAPDGAIDSPTDAARDDAGTVDTGAPLPTCAPVAGSDATIRFDPAAAWAGGTVRVAATAAPDYTNVGVRVVGGTPQPDPRWIGVSGTPHTWSWSLSPLAAGASCVEFFADPASTPYARALLVVGEDAPAVAPFKVTQNHQWTCEEEYEWAINVDVRVEDEAGAPIAGARVALEHDPCDLRGSPEPPAELVTGDDGTVRWENYYPRCFFHLRAADAPSDTAIEIYTGIWETQPDASGADCNYCSEFAQNVWGHWSYSITFRRTPGATEICDVPTDHAGQSRCAPLMHWEEPRGPCTAL
jgi:hypothetical protein